jgi:two-component system, NarL family, nitrate/nitrite response regulator NarL
MIEIGVIDDDQMLLQGMAAWIGSTGDIRLAATATSVEEYLGTADIPKIVILDLNLGNYTDPVRNVARCGRSGRPRQGRRRINIRVGCSRVGPF